ncbi:hypothetical protein CH298_21675 [Rhodococcoides fascians]|uniref:heavy-metal-associated domain-containing protein n=1 Tax=Rhodococcoides fascians TaxID=1828 RepID=UPI000B9A4EA7|nr:hypothetical protein CH303_22030 [Rhodococcus fascians]RZL76229.1 MAG: cation transporter [Rhodococcus sp. (in: high G+C Gram-positive bacteria)]OZF11814.1 hypothetical protein CH298_21675 [Rhodococcus fascians]OZF14583.1 hypothetical protein CH297_22055 [Rhodococcus fascians]OZF71358.1 hypothetical protein CH308_06030 [Rhodococcus fascians]
MPSWSLRVDGLHCRSCVDTVIDEISEIPEVRSVTVELKSGESSVVVVDATEHIADAVVQAALHEGGTFDIVGGPPA